MKPFAPETISKYRDQFRSDGSPEIELPYKGRKFRYFVVPQAKNPELQDFVMRLTPPTEVVRSAEKPEEEAVFGVSESVREDFRNFAVIHEIEEFMFIGIEEKGRCAHAARTEIEVASQELRDLSTYLEMRIRFFENLMVYAKERPKSYTEEDLGEFEASLREFKKARESIRGVEYDPYEGKRLI